MTPLPRAVITAAARREHSSTPRRLTSTTRRSTSVSVSTSLPNGPVTPALLTSPVTDPSRSAAVSNSRSTSASTEVSALTVTQRAPFARTPVAIHSAAAPSFTYPTTTS